MAIVKLDHVSFAYEAGTPIINNIDLEFERGTATAIIGQNGAGKTTTVKLINHLLTPTSGQVMIDGKDIKDLSTAKVALQVGYAFQNPDDQIFNNSIRKEIAFGPKESGLRGDELQGRIDYAAKITGLTDFLDEHPYNFPYSLRKFITIASLLAMDPDVYIFDEPTAGQDHVSRKKLALIIQELTKHDKCVIIITHDMNFVADNFSRVVVLSNHQVLRDGPAREVFTDKGLMQQANIEPPEALTIANRTGITGTPLTVTELVHNLNLAK